MGAPTLTGLEAMALAARAGVDRGPAPVALWNPAHCGVLDLCIRADGVWVHEGAPITRPALVRLFSTVLRRDDAGFWLVTPGEKLKIAVEDAPFVAVAMDQPSPAVLRFATNVGDLVEAGPDHPIRIDAAANGGPRPYLHVRDGLEALIARPVFYELANLAAPEHGRMSVRSHGAAFALEP